MAAPQFDPVDSEMAVLEVAIGNAWLKQKRLLQLARMPQQAIVAEEKAAEEGQEDAALLPKVPSQVALYGLQALFLREAALDAEEFQRLLTTEKLRFENEEESRRLAKNIRRVTNVLAELVKKEEETSLQAQWKAIRKLEYEVSSHEWVWIRAKKIVLTFCAAAIGFSLGVAMGVTMPAGGIVALPAAIFASFKSIIAVLGGASAGVTTSIVGPTFFGFMMGRDEARRQTGSPVEAHMVKMRNAFSAQNSDMLGIALAEQFGRLVTMYGENHLACQMISVILGYSKTLERSAHGLFETGREGRLKKGRASRLGTSQIMEKLLAEPSAIKLSEMDILSMRVQIDDRDYSYWDVLNFRRHKKRDDCLGFFMKRSHTLILAHRAAQKVARAEGEIAAEKARVEAEGMVLGCGVH